MFQQASRLALIKANMRLRRKVCGSCSVLFRAASITSAAAPRYSYSHWLLVPPQLLLVT
jgi:hypothetical protein